jgi:hypothetical protein
MSYRDDSDAARARADAATAEAERLKRENDAMRRAMAQPPPQAYPPQGYPMMPYAPGYMMQAEYPAEMLYKGDVRALPIPERARLAQHQIRPFSVFGAIVLHYITFGLFSWIHFSVMHDKLPKAATNDPSAGKAIGFSFIPYFNLYWVFFNALRLTDRLSLQFKLRGLADRAPKGMATAACIVGIIPYIGWAIGYLITWPILVGMLQSSVNKVAALPPTSFDATPQPQFAGYPQLPPMPPLGRG